VSPAAAARTHGLVLAHPAHPFQTHPLRGLRGRKKFSVVGSNNWSGFATYGDHFRYVHATYSIPSINCSVSPDGSFDSQWVGLDGYNSPTVEQIGTFAQCSGGTPSYYAFYEMYPQASVTYTGVSPGDSISVSVYYDASTQHWNLLLVDETAQSSISESATCPAGSSCKNDNAEVISEVPNGGPPTADLADYGTVGFTEIGITDTAGHRDNFLSRYWKNYKIYEVDSSDNQMQAPGTLEGSETGTGGGYDNQAFIETALASS
jgi:hypothetical protein